MIKSKSIPQSWLFTELKNVGDIVTGNTPSMKFPHYYGGKIPWVKPPDINKNTVIYSAQETLSDNGLTKARLLPEGAVLVTCIGNIGNVALAGVPLATNQQINSIVFNPEIVDYKYGFYWCKTLKGWLIENSTSTTISMINKSRFGNAPFLVAPLKTQKRIADKLDNLYHHLDKLNGRLDRIPGLLKQFRKNVLTQAMNGLPTMLKTLDEITIIITDGDHQAPPKTETGIPFIVISNISNGTLDLTRSTRFVPDTYFEEIKEYRKPQFDDILYTVTGSIGIPVLVDTNEPFSFQRHIGLIRPDKRFIFPKFLFYALKSDNIYKQALNAATGTAQLTIPLSGIRKFVINCPPLEEQKRIVKRIDTLFNGIEKLEAFYQNVKMKMDTFPSNLLAKAFRGELVNQHPDDEPASILLQKITQMKIK